MIWADGKSCPHCGGVDRITKVKANPSKRIGLGLWRCGDCKRRFAVKVGTVFGYARRPLNKALQVVYLMSSKKGISAHQLHRVLEVTYTTAWFLAHRIREAMRSGDLAPFGGEGGVVEVDETYIGGKEGVYQHCAEKYLHRYVAEFEFRYNNRSALGVGDTQRSVAALQNITGKRLTYKSAC